MGAEMIGGVLTYEVKTGTKICGSTIGADGSGEFAIVIEGDPDAAFEWARDYLRKLEESGFRLGHVSLVTMCEMYAGDSIRVVSVSSDPEETRPAIGSSVSGQLKP